MHWTPRLRCNDASGVEALLRYAASLIDQKPAECIEAIRFFYWQTKRCGLRPVIDWLLQLFLAEQKLIAGK